MPSPRDRDVGFGISSGRVSKAAVDLVKEMAIQVGVGKEQGAGAQDVKVPPH